MVACGCRATIFIIQTDPRRAIKDEYCGPRLLGLSESSSNWTMRRTLSRYLVVLFALLQCVAPLLHAHTHADKHFGIHLVHLQGWGETYGHVHGSIGAVAQQVDDEHIVGLSPSLQPRPDPSHLLPADSCATAEPALLPAHAGLGLQSAAPTRLPGRPPHLIPLPAPPPAL